MQTFFCSRKWNPNFINLSLEQTRPHLYILYSETKLQGVQIDNNYDSEITILTISLCMLTWSISKIYRTIGLCFRRPLLTLREVIIIIQYNKRVFLSQESQNSSDNCAWVVVT